LWRLPPAAASALPAVVPRPELGRPVAVGGFVGRDPVGPAVREAPLAVRTARRVPPHPSELSLRSRRARNRVDGGSRAGIQQRGSHHGGNHTCQFTKKVHEISVSQTKEVTPTHTGIG